MLDELPAFRHHVLRVSFTVRDPNISKLQCLLTSYTSPFEKVELGKPYPFSEHSVRIFLSTTCCGVRSLTTVDSTYIPQPPNGGIKDVEPESGQLSLNEPQYCNFDLILPKPLSQRQIFVCVRAVPTGSSFL